MDLSQLSIEDEAAIVAAGGDPEEFLKHQQQPAQAPTTPLSQIRTTADTALKSTATGMAGLAGGAATAAGLAGLGLSATGVGAAVGIPLSIGAGLLTSYLTDKAQTKAAEMFSPQDQAALEAGQQENPRSTMIGNVLGQAAVMRPSLQNIKTAGSGLRNLLSKGATVASEEMSQMLNVGLGAGMGGGQEALNQYRGGQLNVPALAGHTLLGGWLNDAEGSPLGRAASTMGNKAGNLMTRGSAKEAVVPLPEVPKAEEVVAPAPKPKTDYTPEEALKALDEANVVLKKKADVDEYQKIYDEHLTTLQKANQARAALGETPKAQEELDAIAGAIAKKQLEVLKAPKVEPKTIPVPENVIKPSFTEDVQPVQSKTEEVVAPKVEEVKPVENAVEERTEIPEAVEPVNETAPLVDNTPAPLKAELDKAWAENEKTVAEPVKAAEIAPKAPSEITKKYEGTLGTKSTTDRIRAVQNEDSGHYIANKLDDAFANKSFTQGKLVTAPLAEMQKAGKLSPTENQRVMDYLLHKDGRTEVPGAKDIVLTPKEKSHVDYMGKWLKNIADEAKGAGVKIDLGDGNSRFIRQRDGYVPHVIDPEALHTIKEAPSSAKSKDLVEKWVSHIENKIKVDEKLNNLVTPTKEQQAKLKEARHTAETYVKDYVANSEKVGRTDEATFNALRKTAGYGLPYELIDKDVYRVFRRYGNRAANDIAIQQTLGNDPVAKHILEASHTSTKAPKLPNGKDAQYLGTTKEVIDANDALYQAVDSSVPQAVRSISKAISSQIMSTIGTGVRNTISLVTDSSPYVSVRALGNTLKNIYGAMDRARAAGSIKQEAVQGYSETDTVTGKFSKFLEGVTNGSNKIFGRDAVENMTRGLTHAVGEGLAEDIVNRVSKGDKRAVNDLKYRFGDGVDVDGIISKKSATPEEIQRLAANFVRRVQGTYDGSGLPSYMLKGHTGALLSLMKFSVEKSNMITKDVIRPAYKEGNLKPLITYMAVGLGLTAPIIEQLNEFLTNKRGKDLTYKEALTASNLSNGDLVAKAIFASASAGQFGIIGNTAAYLTHKARGESANQSPISAPILSIGEETANTLMSMAKALNDGNDPVDTIASGFGEILKNSSQISRYVDANVIHPQDAKKQEMTRDMNVFKSNILHQDTASTQDPSQSHIDTKPFKDFRDAKTTDEIMKAVGPAVEKAVRDSKGDIIKLRRALSTLGSDSTSIIPNPKTDPVPFALFTKFINETQTPQAMPAKLEEYYKNQIMNKVKKGVATVEGFSKYGATPSE